MIQAKIAWSGRSKILAFLVLLFAVLTLSLILLLLTQSAGDPIMVIICALATAGFVVTTRRSRKLDRSSPEESTPQLPVPGFLAKANVYERILILGGAGTLVIGGIVAASAASANRDSRLDNELMVTLGGFRFFDSAAGSEYTGLMFFGIVLAIVGLLALGAFVTIRAAAR